jgi:hypothetical protein
MQSYEEVSAFTPTTTPCSTPSSLVVLRMMRFALGLVAAAGLVAPTAHGQTAASEAPKDTARWTIGAAQFRAGSMQLGLDRLNDGLAANNRPTFSNTVPTFGIATYARRGRWLAGASIDGSLPHRSTDVEWTTKLSARTATLDGGYVLLDRSRVMVSTNVSLGVRSTSLYFQRRGDFTYDDGLEDPARGVDLTSRSGVVQIGMSAERRFTARWVGVFSVGGQAGAMRTLGAPVTFAGESHVRGTPAQNGGAYMRVVFAKPIARGARAANTASAALLSMLFQ